MPIKATVTTEVDLEDLAEQICCARQDDLIEFIKTLDSYVADLDFTKRLAKFFAAEVKREEK